MKIEEDCPVCRTAIAVGEQDDSVRCECCGARWLVEWDADFVGGLWRYACRLFVEGR